MPDLRIWPGKPYPLGATWDGEGVNFAIFSERATAVELCLFAAAGDATESHRFRLGERTDLVWHAYLPDVRPGQLYGYRVHGPFAPQEGLRFNAAKLLLDPYAKAVSGPLRWDDAHFGYLKHDPGQDLSFGARDNAALMPKCLVVDTTFHWEGDRPPRTPWNRTVIYECHVKGMTVRHPGIPDELRGTYLAMASDPIIDHLLTLGVTAVELMPVHQSVTEWDLEPLGLTNYWGYNTIGFFAPDVRFATGGMGRQVYEFKSMVKALHRAGIEVILDVVFNHTAEGNHMGPTLCLRGIDNHAYYRLDPHEPRLYLNYTGTGNTLNTYHPHVMQLVMDSLRYWVQEMHVDGFRFDLAPALAREEHDVNLRGTFCQVIRQDPVLSQVKLVAEPWDLGPGGYRLGQFPVGWAEWNGEYRDTLRQFWRGDAGTVPRVASRLSGSSDIFQRSGRGTYAGINHVTSHDGFTLHDLVSYERKHNEANGEHNHDGTDAHYSRNWGAEGPTESSRINHMRERIKRNLIASLVFSQGVPMILAGDEMGRTQCGNNNAYCQDNEMSWVDWDLTPEQRELLTFTARAVEIFRSHPTLRRRRFFSGRQAGSGERDLVWIRPDGYQMAEADWADDRNHVLGMLMHGHASDDVDHRGRPVFGDTLLLLVNGGSRSRYFVLPKVRGPGVWQELLNTANPGTRALRKPALNLVAHSLILLRLGDRP